ncbi:MAG: M20/M25/M40 family metallo-hydrolase [Oscillospiraceae bacterium]|jgi:endoglucanase|nr:M20/M25/M40 family metallo-hydrolase [Oscillospiraceae bacterium]
MQLYDLITRLSAATAPSGFEESVFARVQELLAPYVDEIASDALGNLLAVKRCGVPDAEQLMLEAHMDEIGLIITGFEAGFLRFAKIGGVDPRVLPAQRLRILTNPPIFGVIEALPPHIQETGEEDEAVSADKLFVDVGLSEQAAKAKIPLGTAAVFDEAPELLAGERLLGKALDNRACVAILIKAMEELAEKELAVNVSLLISTQEELGYRGAQTGAFALRPDRALVLDVTHAATPDSKKGETVKLAAGAAVGVGPNLSREISGKLLELARKKEIPVQTEVLPGSSGTDAWVIQVSRTGVPTGLISLPLRYMHTPSELVSLKDAECCVRLVTEFVLAAGREAQNA